jgi:hypothetical protein
VVYRAQEYPPLEAEVAVALCLLGVSVFSFARYGVETVATAVNQIINSLDLLLELERQIKETEDLEELSGRHEIELVVA